MVTCRVGGCYNETRAPYDICEECRQQDFDEEPEVELEDEEDEGEKGE